jgi:hypothetical protein
LKVQFIFLKKTCLKTDEKETNVLSYYVFHILILTLYLRCHPPCYIIFYAIQPCKKKIFDESVVVVLFAPLLSNPGSAPADGENNRGVHPVQVAAAGEQWDDAVEERKGPPRTGGVHLRRCREDEGRPRRRAGQRGGEPTTPEWTMTASLWKMPSRIGREEYGASTLPMTSATTTR